MNFESQNLKKLARASIVACVLAGSAMAQAADTVGEANKKTVLAFYEAALVKRDVNAAVSYLGARYIQHNPTAPDGVEGVKGLIKFLAEKFPNRSSNIVRVIADADLVVLHVHAKSNPDDRGTAIVDIFRVENGKIVEHWDVMQPVPEKAANPNSMF